MTEIDIKKAVTKEKNRLKKQFKAVDETTTAVVLGLIDSAAFIKVQLNILEDDIKENGVTEKFSQSAGQKPYDRKRPQAELYNSMNTNYQKIIKQLTDLLPKPDVKTSGKSEDDGFMSFVHGREDL